MVSLLEQQAAALIDKDLPIGSFSNVASLLFHEIEGLNWVGFYFAKNGRLELGPFMGKPACQVLPFVKGVCAKAYREGGTVIVDDVLSFPGHIACDSSSRSEIVVPLHHEGRVIGVLDVDSDQPKRFGEKEIALFENIRDLLEKRLDLQSLSGFLFE